PQHPDHVPLNAAGERQARAAAGALAEVTFDRVICSGLPRTEQTARIVLGERAGPIEGEPRPPGDELGPFAGVAAAPRELVRQAILGTLADHITPESRFLGGETFGSCAERVTEVWRGLVDNAGWRVLLVVAHGVVNRLLLAHVLGVPLAGIGRM